MYREYSIDLAVSESPLLKCKSKADDCCHHALIKSLQRQIEVQHKVQIREDKKDDKEMAPSIILIKHRSQKVRARWRHCASESRWACPCRPVAECIFLHSELFCSNFDFTFSPALTLSSSGVYFCALRLLSTFKLIRSAIIQSKIAEVAKAEVRSGGLPTQKKKHQKSTREMPKNWKETQNDMARTQARRAGRKWRDWDIVGWSFATKSQPEHCYHY